MSVRLAWFTPLPPMPSGISDYSAELLPLVAEAAEVEIVCPPRRDLRVPAGLRARTPETFDPGRVDAAIYHLGNNPQHVFAHDAALRHPGVCVLHDLTLHHLVAYRFVEHERHPERYRAVLVEELGADLGRRVADLRLLGVATELEKFLFPLIGHVARRSRGVVVHSRWGAERVAEVAPDVPTTVIPHHAGSPPPGLGGVDRAEARRRLGLPQDAFLVGHFGFVNRPKQPSAVLGGMAVLRRSRPDARLLVVGADNTGGGLGRTARRFGIADAVRATGFVDLRAFYLHLKAVDAVVNLRYPSAGESSGTLARALAEGRAVVVNRLHAFAEIPDEAAMKVEVDGDPAEQVGRHLVRLAEDPAERERVEAAARAYAARELDPIRCRDAYIRVAADAASVAGASK
ncbi:MAG TPA: glycosyltransferase [Actinomycetota bacterium]|nr:glycosyltransferase [Actinomycetota bacterium]